MNLGYVQYFSPIASPSPFIKNAVLRSHVECNTWRGKTPTTSDRMKSTIDGSVDGQTKMAWRALGSSSMLLPRSTTRLWHAVGCKHRFQSFHHDQLIASSDCNVHLICLRLDDTQWSARVKSCRFCSFVSSTRGSKYSSSSRQWPLESINNIWLPR